MRQKRGSQKALRLQREGVAAGCKKAKGWTAGSTLLLAAAVFTQVVFSSVLTANAEDYYTPPEDRVVVMLDAGHDSLHNGSHSGGMTEEIMTYKVACYARDYLKDYDVKVLMSREGYSCPYPDSRNNYVDNRRRAIAAAQGNADLYVALHFNADTRGRSSGAEIYYQNRNYRPDLSDIAKGAGEKIMEQLTALGLKNHGIMIRNTTLDERYPDGSLMDYYHLLIVPKELGIPALIVEHAYLTSAADRAFCDTDDKLKALGEADARGIINYFGLKKQTWEGVFLPDYYAEHNPDVKAACGNDATALRQHFLTYGLQEGRKGSPIFDINYYMEQNPDLAAAFGDDRLSYMEHFLYCGMAEGRSGVPEFQVYYYRTKNSDLVELYGGDLKQYYLHYAAIGYAEGRKASPETDLNADGTPGTYADYPVAEDPAGICMYRIYNPRSGEHLYTGDTNECETLLSTGWLYEDTAWEAAADPAVPVYRFCNPNNGDHHYTSNDAEREHLHEAGWREEGIGWYSDPKETTPVYRLYNPNAEGAGSHHYTTSAGERALLAKIGWIDEGIAWFGR